MSESGAQSLVHVVELKQEERQEPINASVGFIGWGRMAQGLTQLWKVHALEQSVGGIFPMGAFSPEKIAAPSPIVTDLDQLFATCQIVIIEAPWEQLKAVLPRIRLIVTDAHLLVFLGADVSFQKLISIINEHKMIRCLASPVHRFADCSLVYTASNSVNAQENQDFRQLLQDLPVVLEVDSEKELNAMHGLISTGPAIGYLLIDALADGLLKLGIPRKRGLRLAAHTLFSACRTYLETGVHPAVLRDHSIQDPGIPLSGLMDLEEAGLRGILSKAMESAAKSVK